MPKSNSKYIFTIFKYNFIFKSNSNALKKLFHQQVNGAKLCFDSSAKQQVKNLNGFFNKKICLFNYKNDIFINKLLNFYIQLRIKVNKFVNFVLN